jgi:ABC-type antimicrobial peptide transport system permease subunit
MHGNASHGRTAWFDGSARGQHVEYSDGLVSTGYFGTLGIRLLGGRDFGQSPAERARTPDAVVVNQEFAHKYLDGNAVGHRFTFREDPPIDYEIIGVVANSKYRTLGEEQRPAIYLPLPQPSARRDLGFVFVRADGDASALIAGVRSAIGDVDRSVSVDVQAMRSALAFALLPSRIGAVVLGGLGLLGLILAAFGLFAIVSYNVSRRVSEIAIRTALGATRRAIVGLVIRDASLLVSAGVALGLLVSAMATRVLSAFLVAGLSATDPVSFIGTPVAFLAMTILASWFPARYAMRVSPVIAMRAD